MQLNYDCFSNNLIRIRCCLSSQFNDIVQGEITGKDCSSIEKDKRKFRVRQMYLDKLMSICTDQLEKECLSRDQILEILEILKNSCKPC